MEGPAQNHLRLWNASTLTVVQHPPSLHGRGGPGPHNPEEFAERLYAYESLNEPQPARLSDAPAEPYSLQWFLNIENQRHGRSGRWIPRLLEFAKHSGEHLLGLGNGLGTDWLQYARHGADVVVCSASVEQLALIRRNFELRGLSGRFLHAAPTGLPLETASIDVACVSGLLAEVPDPAAVVREVYRVLKPGGKVLAVTPARYDIDFWFHLVFPWLKWLRPARASMATAPIRYTARSLHRLFADFIEHRIHKRQLRRADVPHIWRWLPMPLLERCCGRVLVIKAFKPLSAANQLPLAA
jgi:SAM-dependent methyltransferase